MKKSRRALQPLKSIFAVLLFFVLFITPPLKQARADTNILRRSLSEIKHKRYEDNLAANERLLGMIDNTPERSPLNQQDETADSELSAQDYPTLQNSK